MYVKGESNMNDIEKRYMMLLTDAFDKQDCEYCNFSVLCNQYRNEKDVENLLCDIVFKADDIIRGK